MEVIQEGMDLTQKDLDAYPELKQIRILVERCGKKGYAVRNTSEGRLELWAKGEYIEAHFRNRTVCLADPQVRVWETGLWQKILTLWFRETITPPGKRPGMENRPISRLLGMVREHEGRSLSGADQIAIEALRRWEDGDNWPEIYAWIRSLSPSGDQFQEVSAIIGRIWAVTAPLHSEEEAP